MHGPMDLGRVCSVVMVAGVVWMDGVAGAVSAKTVGRGGDGWSSSSRRALEGSAVEGKGNLDAMSAFWWVFPGLCIMEKWYGWSWSAHRA